MKNTLTLLPEWAEQEAVVLAWPYLESDWLPWIDEVRASYISLINGLHHAKVTVILLCPEREIGIVKSMVDMHARVLIIPMEYNDTWTRDYVFLTCESAHGNQGLDFIFNAWGNKFDATLDNQVNSKLSALCKLPLIAAERVLEGGAVEIDQNQILLSTKACLLNPKRNQNMSLSEYEHLFAEYFGASKSVILQNGYLVGDDTDGHIDTLVRFTPLRGLVMQSAFNRPEDSHFDTLHALKKELMEHFDTYSIYELPLPKVCNENGQRLPASYANFLICNKHVLAPVYQQPEDKLALETLQKAYPNYKIVSIDCLPIVQQNGSLHCISMQIPENTLKSDVLALAKDGLQVYES